MMRIHALQHEPFEGLAMIVDWIEQKGYVLNTSYLYERSCVLPAASDFDMLLVMGGSMSANDDIPWIHEERQLIQQAIEANKYVLGICLGAQQIAKALGASVEQNLQKEIGWFPIVASDAAIAHPLFNGIHTALSVLHWHSETFNLPKGALHLAKSEACFNQAFLYRNKVLALQFHLEMNEEAVKDIVMACKNDLNVRQENENTFVQDANKIIGKSKSNLTKNTLFKLLDNWLALSV